jgi:hypothetical protein
MAGDDGVKFGCTIMPFKPVRYMRRWMRKGVSD